MDTEQINVLSEFIQALHNADAQYRQIAFDHKGSTVLTWFEIEDFDESTKQKIRTAEASANAVMIRLQSDIRVHATITEVRESKTKPSPFARAQAQSATH